MKVELVRDGLGGDGEYSVGDGVVGEGWFDEDGAKDGVWVGGCSKCGGDGCGCGGIDEEIEMKIRIGYKFVNIIIVNL